MDKAEAQQIAQARLDELEALGWERLRDEFLSQPSTVWVPGASSARYQVETNALWDDAEDGAIRLIVSVDDGGWRAWFPVHARDSLSAPARRVWRNCR